MVPGHNVVTPHIFFPYSHRGTSVRRQGFGSSIEMNTFANSLAVPTSRDNRTLAPAEACDGYIFGGFYPPHEIQLAQVDDGSPNLLSS